MRLRPSAAFAAAAVGGLLAACSSTGTPAARTNADAPGPTTTTGTAPTHPDDGIQLRFGRVTERSIDVDADGRNTTAAVKGMNEFAVDLYKAILAGRSDNVVISPYSAAFTLGMIYAGARGQTASEMASVLHADIPADDWHEGINAYDLTLDARTVQSPTTWDAANKVWTVPGLRLRDEYLDVLTASYGSPLAEADFSGNAEAQRRSINEWIAGRTKDRIPELFPPESLTPGTVMVLVNAVALDAPWEFPFDPAATSLWQFTRPDGSVVNVPFMHYDEYLPSAWDRAYQAVEIPYGGGALSMVVIVPTGDLAAFESSLTADSLEKIVDSIKPGGIHLSLPRWSTRSAFQLNTTLSDMGMPTAFSGGADFSGMVDGGGLALALVQHEAFVEVDETGTRAAAATGGVMVASHGPTVNVNRPFLYLIRDRGAGTILFMGRVTDPSVTA